MNKMMKLTTCAIGGVALICGCGESNSDSRKTPPPTKSAPTTIAVGDVKINMDEVKAAIHTWQKDRWNADAIVKARQTNGKLKVDDLKVTAKYEDLQPVFDLMVADYVVYVNVIDAFADAANAGEAVSGLLKSFSIDDFIKMTKDVANVVDSAKSIKNKAGWKDAIPIGKDMITITALSSSMTNAGGILKSIFDQVMKK